MRKVFNNIALLMFAFVSITAVSCLKDEGYENGEYGSVRGTAGQEFVSVPASARVKSSIAIGVVRKPGIQEFKMFAAAYDAEGRAPEDFTATFTLNNALVTAAYPTANVVDASIYTIPSYTVNFKKGDRISDSLRIQINTETLDPNLLYGLGFTLTSVSKAGVNIPTNLRNVIVLFPVKNKYDGVYNLKGIHNRPGFQYPYETEIHLVTASATSVEFYWPEVSGPGHPIAVGPGNALSWYGSAVSPVIVFDQATDFVADVYNNSTAVAIEKHTYNNPTDPRFAVGDARWFAPTATDPAKIIVYFHYNANNDRAFFDTLYYTGPRP